MWTHDNRKQEIYFLKTQAKKSDVNKGLALCQFTFYLYLVCRGLFLYIHVFKAFTLLSDSVYVTFTIHFHCTGKYNSSYF